MEKYIGTYHKSSPFIQNLLKKQICSFEILWQSNPPPVCSFSQICHWTVAYMCLWKSPPPVFPKSTTGQSPTCACRNFPPQLQIFLKSATG